MTDYTRNARKRKPLRRTPKFQACITAGIKMLLVKERQPQDRIALFLFHWWMEEGVLCACSVKYDSLTLWNWSPPSSFVHGIFQARILEWVAISSSRGSFQPRNQSTSPSASALVGGFFNTEQPGKLHSRTFYLSILDILVCICDLETPNPSLSCHSYPLTTTFVFSLCL